jgi:hypothetical protein
MAEAANDVPMWNAQKQVKDALFRYIFRLSMKL